MSKTVDRLVAEEKRTEAAFLAARVRRIDAERRMYARRKCVSGVLRCKCRGATRECSNCGRTLCARNHSCGICR